MGYSPWGHKELDTAERLTVTTFIVDLQCYVNLLTSDSVAHIFSYSFPLWFITGY